VIDNAGKDSPVDVTVVLVHGIGDIDSGDVLGSAIAGVQRHLGEHSVVESGQFHSDADGQGGDGHVYVESRRIRSEGWTVELVEFHWASVFGKIRLRHPIDAFRKFLGILGEVPFLGTIGSTQRKYRTVAWVMGVLQQTIVLFTLLVGFGAMFEVFSRRQAYENVFAQAIATADSVWTAREDLGEFGRGQARADTLVSSLQAGLIEQKFRVVIFSIAVASIYLFLSVLSLTVAVVLFILSLPRALYTARNTWRPIVLIRIAAAGGLVTVLLGLAMLGLFAIALQYPILQFGLLTQGQSILMPIGVPLIMTVLALSIGAFVGNLLRDVVHYLAPDRTGLDRPHQVLIRDRLSSLLQDLAGEGCKSIVLVSHSLGTVISTDVLRNERGEKGPSNVYLVTAGSPIRRFIQPLMPSRAPDVRELAASLTTDSPPRIRRWLNVYRLFDYVGQALTYWALPLDLLPLPERWLPAARRSSESRLISDHLLRPRYRPPMTHGNYWRDRRFVRFVAERVIGQLQR